MEYAVPYHGSTMSVDSSKLLDSQKILLDKRSNSYLDYVDRSKHEKHSNLQRIVTMQSLKRIFSA